MSTFESGPQSIRDQARLEVQKAANQGGFELVVIEDTTDTLRFQILSNDQMGLGGDEHEEYLASLLESSSILDQDNTKLIVHPNHAYNIVVEF